MAISHVCFRCGRDLARLRALRDPIYGLPLVICPNCRTASVRRRHPLQEGWRRVLRVQAAVAHMFIHAVLAATFATLAIIAAGELADLRRRYPLETILEDYRAGLIAGVFALPLFTGAWLWAGFRHLGAIRTWVIWLAWLAFIIGFSLAATMLSDIERHGWRTALLELPDARWRYGMQQLAGSAPMLGLIVVMSLGGIPIGRLLESAGRTRRKRRWSTRRKRLKRRRLSQ